MNEFLSFLKLDFEKAVFAINPATIGLFIMAQLGGRTDLLMLLFTVMIADMFTGIGVGIFVEKFEPRKMYFGFFKKAALLYLIVIGLKIDVAFSTTMVKNGFICFVIGYEGLSMLENYDKLGLPAPKGLSVLMKKLKSAGDALIDMKGEGNE